MYAEMDQAYFDRILFRVLGILLIGKVNMRLIGNDKAYNETLEKYGLSS